MKKSKNKNGNINIDIKKIIILGIILLIICAVIFFILHQVKQDTEIPSISELVANKTNNFQEDIKLENVNISSKGSNIIVSGISKNQGNDVKTMDIVLYLYNDKGQLKGNTKIPIDNLKKSETKEFNISIMGSYENIKDYEIKIENLQR